MGKPQGTTPEFSQLTKMAEMIVNLEHENTKLQYQLLETQHELAIRMDILHEYPWCCGFAMASNGWNHDFACKNWVQGF